MPEMLERLYQEPELQSYLDCHLLSEYYANPLYKLHISNTFHYHNLPDLTNVFRQIIICKDSVGANILTNFTGIFCIQNKTKKNVVELHRVDDRAMVNLCHGLLLGLYPYCLQKPAFNLRCEIAGKLREAMCTDTEFVKKYEHLVGLALLEYYSNVIADFCPVEAELLQKQGGCRMIINQLCDTFREEIKHMDLEQLNRSAKYYLPSVQRYIKQYHNKIHKPNALPMANIEVSDEILDSVLEKPVIKDCNQLSLIHLVHPTSLENMMVIEGIWKNVQLNPLPLKMYEDQLLMFEKMVISEKWRTRLKTLPICMHCTIGQKKSILTQRSCYDAVNKRLHCLRCKRALLEVNLLGRILTVKSTSYYLCCRCLKPKEWSQPCPCETKEITYKHPVCIVCSNKNTVFSKKIINVQTMNFDVAHLCSKHAKHIIRSPSTIYDLDMLLQEAESK